MSFRTSPAKLWRHIRELDNKYSGAPDTHEAITTANNNIPSPKEQSNLLNAYYASISRLPHHPDDRGIDRAHRRLRPQPEPPPAFTPDMTGAAIRCTKVSGSTGVDGLSYRHLRHLGPVAVGALTAIFNRSISHNSIPNAWKIAKIVPILKPNKVPTEPSSYRPISLLCSPVKILERLVLNTISPHIPLSPSQHGFRAQHSTTTLLATLTQYIQEGMNAPRPAYRTLLATIDISKAFDTIPRTLLIQKIFNTDIDMYTKKWLANYLTGRHAFTLFGEVPSSIRRFTNGVPQGSVLSPILFNLFLHDIPLPTHPDTHILSYADDITIFTQHPDPLIAAKLLQDYLHLLEDWLRANRLKVSPAKSTLTLITPWNREYNLQTPVTLFGDPIPYTNTPTTLGVTYDRGLTFSQHVRNVNTKAKTRLNVLRALTNTSFGHSKEDIAQVYKQFIRPILTYAHLAWQPDIANSHMDRLQTTQNSALRIATGCTSSTPVHHLHHETRVLPIRQHMCMRGTHIYTSTEQPTHPLHHLRQAPLRRQRASPPHMTAARFYQRELDSLPPLPRGHHSALTYTPYTPGGRLRAPPRTLCWGPVHPRWTPHWSGTYRARIGSTCRDSVAATTRRFPHTGIELALTG